MKNQQTVSAILAEINEKGRSFCYTKGTSMLPMLKEGRDISVLVLPEKDLHIGDVVLFARPENNNELVLHRIVKKVSKDKFLIRGDHTYFDEPVSRENIIAVLEGFFRKGKYIDCKKSKRYRLYTFAQLKLYFIRKFFCKTLIALGAKVKNKLLHFGG